MDELHQWKVYLTSRFHLLSSSFVGVTKSVNALCTWVIGINRHTHANLKRKSF